MESQLRQYLSKCRNTIKIGYTSTKIGGIEWLNRFCGEFTQFNNLFHTYLTTNLPNHIFHEGNEHIECCFLCLTQILCCIKHIERTLKTEHAGGIAISDARQHFLDRIHFCLDKLRSALKSLEGVNHESDFFQRSLEMWSFIELLDEVLDNLSPYCNYEEETYLENVAKENAEAIFASKQIRTHVDLLLGQALGLANVALHQDKRALSALCQKVHRECIALEEECLSTAHKSKMPDSNRKFKAIALEKALLQLENYINDSLQRLVFRCFLDYEKYSIEKLRMLLRLYEGHDESALDELIADFDVNVDRTSQIGNFAIAFAPTIKDKTIIRSALASFESLDACIIPALHGKNPAASVYSELLEQHFNEEVLIFKNAIQKIIDSYAFTSCYHDLVAETLKEIDKQYDKVRLQELVQMGEFLHEHFQIKINNIELHKQPERMKMFDKFTLMLRECQAILMCANQVDTQRVIKRFKILRSVLYKFLNTLIDLKSSTGSAIHKDTIFETTECEIQSPTIMLETMGITPSKKSILYGQENEIFPEFMRRRAVSDSLRGNTSKFPLVTPTKPCQAITLNTDKLENCKQASDVAMYAQTKVPTSTRCDGKNTNMANNEEQRHSIRRRWSLRTAMFKRQKSTETAEIYSIYKNNSTSLQITEILDQLSKLSSDFSNITETIDSK